MTQLQPICPDMGGGPTPLEMTLKRLSAPVLPSSHGADAPHCGSSF